MRPLVVREEKVRARLFIVGGRVVKKECCSGVRVNRERQVRYCDGAAMVFFERATLGQWHRRGDSIGQVSAKKKSLITSTPKICGLGAKPRAPPCLGFGEV